MRHFDDFVRWFNEEVGGNGHIPLVRNEGVQKSFGEAMEQSMFRHFGEDRQRGGLRMSSIGKPAVVQALAKLGYTELEPKGKSRYIFMTGDFFENSLECFFQMYGIHILEAQTSLEYLGISGHLDFVVKSPVTREPVIVEAKTMSSNYARMFKKEQDDSRGYLSQLAMYKASKQYDASWLCLDKGNSDLFEIEPNLGELDAALNRASQVISRMDRVKSLDDVLSTFRIPPPRPEKFRNAMTGKMIAPPSLSYSPFKTALYKITTEPNGYKRDTDYVVDLADTEHMKQELEFLVENGVIAYNG